MYEYFRPSFRQPYLDLLKSIITNQRDNLSGYSFAINGEWGCGKTWLLKKLEPQLITENKDFLIFHYNACGMRATSISMNLSITH
ncbi:MAG: hypothetical protein IJW57_02725 [Spirochaetaceae bacterium]|nr:hypothetical protein [Spirochaetaceae bacterium]MBQ7882393.1 hypothetical protein [Treponema sp.]